MATIDLPSLTQAAVGSVVLYLLYCVYWELTIGTSRRRMIKENGCLPVKKLPQKDPFFGFDLFRENIKSTRERTLLSSNLKRFQRMGNTFEAKLMGTTFYMTTEPEVLKTIQSLSFKHWSLGNRRKAAFIPLLGEGIFTTDGAPWAHSREMLRPNFVRSQVGDPDTFETHVSHLIQAIPRDGSTVDLQELFFRLTIDSATEFLFGESTNCLAPGTSTVSSSAFAAAWNRALESVAFSGRFGLIGRILPNRQHRKDTKYIHDFVDAFVEKGLQFRDSPEFEKTDRRYVFLHELVKQTSDKVQIRSELLNILLAGRDTTASLLSNVWFELSKRPDIWAKLRAEVDELNGERPTFQQIKDMKYLRNVLNESLRLYPVVPGNSRQAVQDTVIPVGGGPDGKSPAFVPKGGMVAWSVFSMHRRKDFYGEDAEEFKPERWEKLRPGWEYLPFNGGPRICIGQQFALTETSYTTIRLMQAFKDLECRDPEPWTEWLTLTCTGRGCKVALTPAN